MQECQSWPVTLIQKSGRGSHSREVTMFFTNNAADQLGRGHEGTVTQVSIPFPDRSPLRLAYIIKDIFLKEAFMKLQIRGGP